MKLLLVLFAAYLIGLEAKKYKVKLLSVKKCDAPPEKRDPSEPVLYETTMRRIGRRNSAIRTNFTVLRTIGPMQLSFRISTLQPREQVFHLERVDCHSPFTYQLVRVVHLELDNDCYVKPGTYSTENINLQDFAWILSKVMVSTGKYVYDLEFYTKDGLAACNTIVCDISETK